MAAFFNFFTRSTDKRSPGEQRAQNALIARLGHVGIVLPPNPYTTENKQWPSTLPKDQIQNLEDARAAIALADAVSKCLKEKAPKTQFQSRERVKAANKKLQEAQDILDEYLENEGIKEPDDNGGLESEKRNWPEFCINAVAQAHAYIEQVIEQVLEYNFATINVPGDGDCCPCAFMVAALNVGLQSEANKDKVLGMLLRQAMDGYSDTVDASKYPGHPMVHDLIKELDEATANPGKITAFRSKYFDFNKRTYAATKFLAACARCAIEPDALARYEAAGKSDERQVLLHIDDFTKLAYQSAFAPEKTIESLQENISNDVDVATFFGEMLAAIKSQHGGKLSTEFDEETFKTLLATHPKLKQEFAALIAKHSDANEQENVTGVVHKVLVGILEMRYRKAVFLEEFQPGMFMNVEHVQNYAANQEFYIKVKRRLDTGAVIDLPPCGDPNNPCIELVIEGSSEQTNQHWQVVDRQAPAVPAAAPAMRSRPSPPPPPKKPSLKPSSPPVEVTTTAAADPSLTFPQARRRAIGALAKANAIMYGLLVTEAAANTRESTRIEAAREVARALRTECETLGITREQDIAIVRETMLALKPKKSLQEQFKSDEEKLAKKIAKHVPKERRTEILKGLVNAAVIENDPDVKPEVAADATEKYAKAAFKKPSDFTADAYADYIKELVMLTKKASNNIVVELLIGPEDPDEDKDGAILKSRTDVLKRAIRRAIGKTNQAVTLAKESGVAEAISENIYSMDLLLDPKKTKKFGIKDLISLCGEVIDYLENVEKVMDLGRSLRIELVTNDLESAKIKEYKLISLELLDALGAIDQVLMSWKGGLQTSLLNADGFNLVYKGMPVATLEDMLKLLALHTYTLKLGATALDAEVHHKKPIANVPSDHSSSRVRFADPRNTTTVEFLNDGDSKRARQGLWELDAPSGREEASEAEREALKNLLKALKSWGVSPEFMPEIVYILINLKAEILNGELHVNYRLLDHLDTYADWVDTHITPNAAAKCDEIFFDPQFALIPEHSVIPVVLKNLFIKVVGNKDFSKLAELVSKVKSSGDILDVEDVRDVSAVMAFPAGLSGNDNEDEDEDEDEYKYKDEDEYKDGMRSETPALVRALKLAAQAARGLAQVREGARGAARLLNPARGGAPAQIEDVDAAERPGSPPPVQPISSRRNSGRNSGLMLTSRARPAAQAAPPPVTSKVSVEPVSAVPMDVAALMAAGRGYFDSTYADYVGHEHYINQDVALRVVGDPATSTRYNICSKRFAPTANASGTRHEEISDPWGTINTSGHTISSSFAREKTYEASKLFLQSAKACAPKRYFMNPDLQTTADAAQFVRAFLEVFAPRDGNNLRMLLDSEISDTNYFEREVLVNGELVPNVNVNIYLPPIGSEARKLMQAALYEYLMGAKLELITTENSTLSDPAELELANARLLQAFKEFVGFDQDYNPHKAIHSSQRVLGGYGYYWHYKLGRGTKTAVPIELPFGDENSSPNNSIPRHSQ